MGIFQSYKTEVKEEKNVSTSIKEKKEVIKIVPEEKRVKVIEDSDTFILDTNLEKRELGEYISTIKDIIDMTIKKEREDIEEEIQKKEKILKKFLQCQITTNNAPLAFKNIKKIHICSENEEKQIYNFGHCPMLYGLYMCYGCHESISLSPDDFWLMIIQSFSLYVYRNSEQLRDKFVNFEGKKSLEIILLETYMKDLTKEKYEKCFDTFNEQISLYIGKELLDILQSDFSTSGFLEKTVSKIGIMTALQNYFEYTICCIGCGFPSITLTGTPEDYEKILEKIKFLKQFELGWWYDILKPIILKLIETKKCLAENKKENIDMEFWRQMIKKETKEKKVQLGSELTKYKTDFISGWIVNFFPFGKEGKRRDFINKYESNKLGFMIETNCKEIAGEMQCVPLKIEELINKKTYNCFLYNGFLGFERDDKERMKPVVGWFLAEC